jgi:hypothetical protein
MIKITNSFNHLRYLGFTRFELLCDTNIQEEVLNFLKDSDNGYFNYMRNGHYLIVSIRGNVVMQLALRYGDYIKQIIKPLKEE